MSSAKSGAERSAEAKRVSKVMRAASHPVRVTALAAFSQGEFSPIELSRALDHSEWTLGVIAYHVRVLAATGLIELAGTIQRRGAIEHVYALTRKGRALADAVDRLTSSALVPRRPSRPDRPDDPSR
jgi:DNA-binding transcriptional ArsR family regulator